MAANVAAPGRATFSDEKHTYEAALQSLFSGRPEDTEADLARLCTPAFTLTAEELVLDWAGFVKHMRWLRENLQPGAVSLTTELFLRDGRRRAELHTSTTRRPDGTVQAAETYQFAEVAEDGRFAWIREVVWRKGPAGAAAGAAGAAESGHTTPA